MADETDDAQSGDDAAPGDEAREALAAELTELLGDAVVETHIETGQNLWLRIELEHWRTALAALREHGFVYFGFLSAIDWSDAPEGRYEDTEFDAAGAGEDDDATSATAAETVRRGGGETRFQMLAQLHAPARHAAVLIKADLPDTDGIPATVQSIVEVFAGADWHEREAHEMFGIVFDGHPNLAHIYLPTEFEGHPLRKDFPLLARAVKPWPGVVDIEEIPPELEAQLEAEVMAEFEASGAGA